MIGTQFYNSIREILEDSKNKVAGNLTDYEFDFKENEEYCKKRKIEILQFESFHRSICTNENIKIFIYRLPFPILVDNSLSKFKKRNGEKKQIGEFGVEREFCEIQSIHDNLFKSMFLSDGEFFMSQLYDNEEYLRNLDGSAKELDYLDTENIEFIAGKYNLTICGNEISARANIEDLSYNLGNMIFCLSDLENRFYLNASLGGNYHEF